MAVQNQIQIPTSSGSGHVEFTPPDAMKWQAVCQDGNKLPLCEHTGTWFGPERNTKNEAQKDADDHKRKCSHHNPAVVQW